MLFYRWIQGAVYSRVFFLHGWLLPHCICCIFFIHSSIKRHSDYINIWFLWKMLQWTWSAHIALIFWFQLSGINIPKWGSPGSCGCSILVSIEEPPLFSIAAWESKWSPTCYKVLISPHNFSLPLPLILARMKRSFTLALICISLMFHGIRQVCVCCPFISILWKNIYLIP